MSWLSRISRCLAVPVIAALITACGFTPVYKQVSQHKASQYLSLIEVAPIDGKHGLQLRNRLEEKIFSAGSDASPRYRLSVNLNRSTEAVLIQLDNTATRQNLKMNASFILSDISTGAKIYTGSAVSIGSYNVVDSEFATIAAEDNAAERAALEIGEDIVDLLVVYFSRSKS